MIWFTLALFLVSFIITALLAPKPEFENARADQLDDVQFPQATENAPIPLVLGQVRLNGPNTLWYGDFEAVPITQKVKTGLFSSKRVIIGHSYYLGLDMGLCLGPNVDLREIYIDDELAWSGTTGGVNEVTINVNQGSLFGGYKEGGGWTSTGKFYGGDFTQSVDSYLESQIGVGDVPAYNGLSHIVFNKAYIGESAQLRKMAFVLESYTNSLGLPDNGTCNGGKDMNVAEAIYQIMVDPWRGLGVAVGDIDITALQQIGVVLHAEQNGCSVLVTSESDGKRLITELLRQIDAIMYQDPDTGKVTMSLIRDDYVIDDLPIFDENDILEVKSFTRTSWDEVQAQVKVTFPQRDRDSEAVAISQDMAVIATIGRLRSTTLGFPFVYDPDLANAIASRERSQRSVPLFRATLEVNRNANKLRPGQPFRFSWPDYGIIDLVMRVQRFDLGSLTKGKIVIEALQDRFALSDVVFASPQTSNWVNVTYSPVDIVTSRIVQMPRFFTSKLGTPIDKSMYGTLAVAVKPSNASVAYSAHVQEPGEAIADGSLEPASIFYSGSGLLTSAYPKSAGFASGLDATGFALNSVSGDFIGATTAEVKNDFVNIVLVDDEFMAFESAVDGGSGNWTLTNVYRGLFGSQIAAHSLGARVYSVPVEAFGDGNLSFITGGNYNFRLLDTAGGVTQVPEEITPQVVNVSSANNINDKPVRPGYVQLNGTRTYNPVITSLVALPLTWRPRDYRVLPVTFEDGAAETPAWSESYEIDVFVGGMRNATLSGTVGAGVLTYNIPFNATVINNDDTEIRVRPVDVTNTKTGLLYASYPIRLRQTTYAMVFTNPGAETGVTGWTSSLGTLISRTSSGGYPAAHGGTNFFAFSNNSNGLAYQDVAVPVGAYGVVDGGSAIVQLSYWQAAYALNNDKGRIDLEYFDGGMVSLGTVTNADNSPGAVFTNYLISGTIPANTRTIRVKLVGTFVTGSACDALFDDISGLIA